MPQTKPFSEIAGEAKADPARRARIQEMRRAVEDALAPGDVRSQSRDARQKIDVEMEGHGMTGPSTEGEEHS